MKPFLRRAGQTLLISVTLGGSAIWLMYLGWIREPMLDWQVVLAGFLLSAALGWWPTISLAVLVALELLVEFFPGLPDRRQIMEEIAVFWALGLGIGAIARQFLQHHESLLLDETRPIRVVAPSREAGRIIASSEPVPPIPRSSPIAQPDPVEDIALPASLPFSAAPAPAAIRPSPPPAPASLPFSRPAVPSPPSQPPPVQLTAAAPLRTQELDLGEFRAWVANQQAAPAPQASEASELPTGLTGRRSSSGASSLPAESSSSSAAFSPGILSEAETDPASPHAQLLLWYNQFSAWPWTEASLQRRYPGGGWLEQAAEDIRAALDLHRSARRQPLASGHFDLEDVQAFLRCELRFLLRRQGAPDLHVLSPQHPPLDWLSAYQEARRPARGGEARVRDLAPEVLGSDPARGLAGRPDALLEVAGQCEVVTLVRPTTPQEALSGIGALGAAQLAVAANLGIPLSGGLALVFLPTTGDRRTAPRITVVDDIVTEFRRLDGMLERMRRILEGSLAPKAQSRPAVCDACGHRHACPGYAGQRPRQDLSDPPALFARFQP